LLELLFNVKNNKVSQKYLVQIQEFKSGYNCFLVLFHHHMLLEIIHLEKCHSSLYFTSQYTKYMGTFESLVKFKIYKCVFQEWLHI
jgi:hypothetical protein